MRIDEKLSNIFLNPCALLRLFNMILAQTNKDHSFGNFLHKTAMESIIKYVEVFFSLNSNDSTLFFNNKWNKVIEEHNKGVKEKFLDFKPMFYKALYCFYLLLWPWFLLTCD